MLYLINHRARLVDVGQGILGRPLVHRETVLSHMRVLRSQIVTTVFEPRLAYYLIRKGFIVILREDLIARKRGPVHITSPRYDAILSVSILLHLLLSLASLVNAVVDNDS